MSFGGDANDYKLKVIIPVLRVESDRIVTSPLPPALFPQMHLIKILR